MKKILLSIIFLLSLQVSFASNLTEDCTAPTIDSVSTTSTTITIHWTNNNTDDPALWKLAYYKNGVLFVIPDIPGDFREYTITGLDPGTYYDGITLRANCYEDVYSDISNSEAINTLEDFSCTPPENFTATLQGSQSVVLTWDDQPHYRWEIVYGLEGFDNSSDGTHVFAQTNNLYLSGFMLNQTYDFYIRTWCDEALYSVWSSKVQVHFTDKTPLPEFTGPTTPDNCCNSYVPIPGKKYVVSGWVKERHFTTHTVNSDFPVDLLRKLYNEELIAKVKDGTYNEFNQGYNPLDLPVYAPLRRHIDVAYPGIYNFSYYTTSGSPLVVNPNRAYIEFSFKENSGNMQKIEFYNDFENITSSTVEISNISMNGNEYIMTIINDKHQINCTDQNSPDCLTVRIHSKNDTNHYFLNDYYIVEDYYQLPRYENSGINIAIVDISGVVNTPLGFFRPSGHVIDGWQRVFNTFTIPENVDVDLNFAVELVNLNQDDTRVFFDDIRIVPYHGNIKSFVYDNTTKKLMAELDENNFATFYEYDKEGGLIRIKKETERGIYTIQETRSNTTKR